MLASTNPHLVSLPEIASMTRVQRPVVTNWRRRYPDFPPQRAAADGQPLFDGIEVVAWLIRRRLGKADAAQLQAGLSRHTLSGYARRVSGRVLVEVVGSLLCLRHLSGRPLVPELAATDPVAAAAEILARAERLDSDDEFVLRELRAAGAVLVELASLAEELIEAAYDSFSAYECLLDARARLSVAELVTDMPGPELTGLIAGIADISARLGRRVRVSVADPHARCGDLLAALVRSVDDRERVQILAAEADPWLARLTRRRLLLAGVEDLLLDVQAGVDLEEAMADPDVIATMLPYQPGERRAALAVLDGVERVADQLGSGSTGLVVGPAAALVDALRGTEEAKRRAALLRSGVVEAVISLPGGVIPSRAGHRSALWVLTRDPVAAARGYVLLADAALQELDERLLADLITDVLLWRAEGVRHRNGHDPRTGRVVPILTLDARPHAPLMPSGPALVHLRGHAIDDRPALIDDLELRLDQAHEQTRRYTEEYGPLRGRVVRRTGRGPARVTLGALIADKRVTLLPGHRLDPAHITADGNYRVLGAPEVSADLADDARRIDWFTVAADYGRIALTRPGDVIYTSAPAWAVMVDPDGSCVIEFPARGLRINPKQARGLTGRVLAALLGAARNAGRSPRAVRAARRIEELDVPDLEQDEAVRIDALLVEIERRSRLLRDEAATLIELRLLTVAGLADGTLTIEPNLPTTR